MYIKADSPVSALFSFWTFTAVKHLRPSPIAAKHSFIHLCCLTVFFSEFPSCNTSTWEEEKPKHHRSKVQFTQAVIMVAMRSSWFAYLDLHLWVNHLYCKQSWCWGCVKPRGANRERRLHLEFQLPSCKWTHHSRCISVPGGLQRAHPSLHLSSVRCNKSRRVQGISGSQKTEAAAGEADGGKVRGAANS